MPDPSQFNTDRTYPGRYCSKMTLLPLGLFTATFNSSCRRGPDSALWSMKKNWHSTAAAVANYACACIYPNEG